MEPTTSRIRTIFGGRKAALLLCRSGATPIVVADEREDPEMRYMFLIYDDEQQRDRMTKAERKAGLDEYMAYSKALADAGIMRAGDGLKPTSTATTIRVRSGKSLTTDGPFAETKEQL